MRGKVLRHQVTIQQRATGRDAQGQADGDWFTVRTCRADCEPQASREFTAAGQVQESTALKVTIRYVTGIHGGMRLLWRGDAYDIEGDPFDVRGQRQWLEIMAASGVRDAR